MRVPWGLVFAAALLPACQAPAPAAGRAAPAVAPAATETEHAAAAPSGDSAAAPAPPTAQLPATEAGATLEQTRWASTDGAHGGPVWWVRFPDEATWSVHTSATLAPITAFAPEPEDGPFAIINGGFYEAVPDEPATMRPMGVVIADGVAISPYRFRGGSGVVWAADDGVPRLTHRDDWPPGAPVRHALQSIDRLVVDGASVVGATNPRRAARSAFVWFDGGIGVVVALDDVSAPDRLTGSLRATVSAGPTLAEFADLLAAGGAAQALNLDGAVSTGLVAEVDGVRLALGAERGTLNAVRVVR